MDYTDDKAVKCCKLFTKQLVDPNNIIHVYFLNIIVDLMLNNLIQNISNLIK